MEEEGPTPRQLLGMSLVMEGGMGLLALALSRWLGRPLFSPLDWAWQSVGWGVTAGLPLLVALMVAVRLPVRPLQELVRVMQQQIVPLFRRCELAELALISILAGFGEEMLFRGVVQGAIGDWMGAWVGGSGGTWIGIACAAILFGLLHPITVTYAVLAGVIGVYLGWLLMVSDNLLIPVTAHAVYDFLALVYLVRWRGAESRTVDA